MRYLSLGFPLLPCETASPSIRLHEGLLDDHWDAGYLVEFRSCSSPLLPLHKCLQITGLTSHASHTDALSDGVVAVSACLGRDQIWITTCTLHFRSGFGPRFAGSL